MSLDLVAIAAMALVTALLRAGGYWAMRLVPMTPRLERILAALPGAIVVALIAPGILRAGLVGWATAAATVAAMLVLKNAIVALVIGILTAIALRAAGL